MNLNIFFGLLVYYCLISVFFISAIASDINTSDSSQNIAFNNTILTDSEVNDIGTGSSFSAVMRFVSLLLIGVGLPAETPDFITSTFAVWQIALNIFTIGFIFQALRGG